MRLSIFVGLLYVAWCINPPVFDAMTENEKGFVVAIMFLGLIGDIHDLFKSEKK